MRQILLIAFSIFIIENGYSQKIVIGLESSLGTSNAYNTSVTTTFRESHGFALISAIKLKSNLYLQVGLGYDRNGYKYHVSYSGQEGYSAGDLKISQNYLTVPMYLRISNLGINDKLNIKVGIFYSYMISYIESDKGYAVFTDGRDRMDWETKKNKTNDIINLGRNDFGIGFDIARTIVAIGKLKIDLGFYTKIGLLATIKPDLSKNYSLGIKMTFTKDSKN